ncbi:MAG: polar amino acid transport system substrate-binding protein [Pseudomonadota bacterium]|nr:polar amino acid transport system substrate-binding protein [Pseudomonadota bacterium]MDQ5881267.1 polar amino acid transport system substrate-binding protein [Pseudomonadota bacterium]
MPAVAEPLLVSYIEKPPYYYTDPQGKPRGFMIERVRQVMTQAGVDYRLEAKPPSRVLHELRHEAVGNCSIGWFKTAEREGFARFTQPIYYDRPLIAAALPARAAELKKASGLAGMLALPGVRVGAVAGYSYGDAVDQMLTPLGERVDRAPAPSSNFAKLVAGRFDFAIFNTEDLDHLVSQAPELGPRVARINLPDVPPGKARHLMCSLTVDPALIQRFDQAISRLRFDRVK